MVWNASAMRRWLMFALVMVACRHSPRDEATPHHPDVAARHSDVGEAAPPTGAQPATSESAEPRPDDDVPTDAWQRCAQVAESVVSSPRSIRDVDWCNHEYIAGLVELRDGTAELHEYMELGGEHDTHIWKLIEVVYGDVDGDGRDEAAVLIHSENWAQGRSWFDADLHMFSLRGATVVSLGSAPASLTDRRNLTIGSNEVLMSYQRDAKSCTDRWTVVNDSLMFDSSRCSP